MRLVEHRLHYYTAEEAAEAEEEEMIPEAPAQEPLAGTRPGAKHVARPTLGASKPKASGEDKVKKPTVAQLATSLESILNTLPVLTRWRSCLRGQRLWRLHAGTLALQP